MALIGSTRGRGWREEGIERTRGDRKGGEGGDEEGGTHLTAVYPALFH